MVAGGLERKRGGALVERDGRRDAGDSHTSDAMPSALRSRQASDSDEQASELAGGERECVCGEVR